jgi:hypothetical protein
MRLGALIGVVVAAVVCCAPGAGARSAAAAASCDAHAANAAAHTTLLPWADRHAPRVYGEFGGIAKLHYQRGTLICRDLTGDGVREMLVQMVCCTGGSPSPWGIFRLDGGHWRQAYARAADTVFRLTVSGGQVHATMPAPYEGACTTMVRDRIVRWTGARFASRLAHRRHVQTRC